MTRLCGSGIAVDPKHIERRKSRATVFKKRLNLLIIFGFIRLIAGQLDLKAKLPSVNLDFPLPFLLFQVQNLGEVMPHLLTYLPVVTDSRSIY